MALPLLKYLPDPLPHHFPRVTQQMMVEQQQEIEELRRLAEPKPRTNALSIKLSEHWSVVGATGSGKTHFSTKGLLEYLRRMHPDAKRYVIDSTADPNITRMVHAPRLFEGNKLPGLLSDSVYTSVWTPDTDDPALYEHFLAQILYAREKSIVLIDELASLVGYAKSAEPPESYIKLLKQGRKHGMTVITGTQEIARVPLTVFRQMTHFCLFRIQPDPYETHMARKYLAQSPEEHHTPMGKYGFWYRRVDGNYRPREFTGMSSFFKYSPLEKEIH